MNFLVDEAFLTGKGANAVISMVHYYLEHHGVHSAIVHFNADNCTGQNKNNPMIWVKMQTLKTMIIHIPILLSFSICYGECSLV